VQGVAALARTTKTAAVPCGAARYRPPVQVEQVQAAAVQDGLREGLGVYLASLLSAGVGTQRSVVKKGYERVQAKLSSGRGQERKEGA
jgi:hypothetical protein